jgi:hypothetical protein
MDEGKYKRKELKDAKREAMKKEYDSTKQRKAVKESFNREFRSLKRSEKNKVKQDIKKEFGV